VGKLATPKDTALHADSSNVHSGTRFTNVRGETMAALFRNNLKFSMGAMTNKYALDFQQATRDVVIKILCSNEDFDHEALSTDQLPGRDVAVLDNNGWRPPLLRHV
jgi:hypothetical protein